MCEGVCVHVSCVSGNVEMRAFTAEGIETQYLYFKTAHFCSIDNATYLYSWVFVWVLLLTKLMAKILMGTCTLEFTAT